MQTFEQFYYKFLVEYRYLPIKPRSTGHNPYVHYSILSVGGQYGIFLNNGENIGTIVPEPPRIYFSQQLRTQRNIHAALGVYSENIPDSRMQPKIYAFHLAKNRLDHPGARHGNADDFQFFRKTYRSTAEMLQNFIRQHGRDNVSVVIPFSTNNFNTRVLDIAGVGEGDRITVDKFTYEEARRVFWNNSARTQECIKEYNRNDTRKQQIYALLRYLGRPGRDDDNRDINVIIGHDPVTNNNIMATGDTKVSLEKLAKIMARIVNTDPERNNNGYNLYRNFYNYITNNENPDAKVLNDYAAYFEHPNDRDRKEDGTLKTTVNKSWFLGHLKSVYFRDIPANIDLKPNVAVVEDNINSRATYDSVNNKLTEKRGGINIQWFVGIVPLDDVPPTYAEREEAAIQQLERERREEGERVEEEDREEKAAKKAANALIRNEVYTRILAGNIHTTTDAVNGFKKLVQQALNDKKKPHLKFSAEPEPSGISETHLTFKRINQ